MTGHGTHLFSARVPARYVLPGRGRSGHWAGTQKEAQLIMNTLLTITSVINSVFRRSGCCFCPSPTRDHVGLWTLGKGTDSHIPGLPPKGQTPTYLAGLLSTSLGFGTRGSITSLAFPTRNAKIDVKYSNRNLTGRHRKQIMPSPDLNRSNTNWLVAACFETNLTILPTLALNSRSFFLHFQSAWIAGVPLCPTM